MLLKNNYPCPIRLQSFSIPSSQPTYADLSVLDLLLRLSDPEDSLYGGLDRCDARFLLLRHFPLLRGLTARAAALPGVAQWLRDRPEEARVVEKVLDVTKTWRTVYAVEIRRPVVTV